MCKDEAKGPICEQAKAALAAHGEVATKQQELKSAEVALQAAREVLAGQHAALKSLIGKEKLSLPLNVSIGDKLVTVGTEQISVHDALRAE